MIRICYRASWRPWVDTVKLREGGDNEVEDKVPLCIYSSAIRLEARVHFHM
jgi:hypothetical protein